MEAAGLNMEASQFYYQALLKKPDFIEARQALYRTGEQVVNNKLSSFFQQSKSGLVKEAVYTYIDIDKYVKKMKNVKVELEIPATYTADFENLKAQYVAGLYEEGLEYMDGENYQAAETVFKEIGRLEPNYKDSKKLEKIAYVEPLYRKGSKALEEGRYRTAYYAFDEVVKVDAGYKDAKLLRDEALQKGMVTIGILSIENGTPVVNADKKAEAHLITALSKTDDPFLKVIDRTDYNRIIEEQKLNLSGIVDESTAAEAGKLLGVKFLLGGTLLEFTQTKGRLQKVKKAGFKKVKIKKHNSETDEDYYVYEYRKVYYWEYSQENKAYVSAQVKLISLTTGETVFSKIVSKENTDKIHYIVYEGNSQNLYPSVDGKPDTSYQSKNFIDRLAAARRKITSPEILAENAFKAMAGKIKSELENFSYNYVK